MSDEGGRDETAGVGNATEDIDATGDRVAGGTVVVTRPQRPTGKRSRQRVDADVDEDTGDGGQSVRAAVSGPGFVATLKKVMKAVGPVMTPIVFVYNYLKQVVAEMRKVIWPSRKQLLTYTSVVLVFLAFMVTLVGLADFGLTKLVLLVFS